MALQRIWIGLFVLAVLFTGIAEFSYMSSIEFEMATYDVEQSPSAEVVDKLFGSAKGAANLLVSLLGVWTFWLGLLKVAEKAGLVDKLANALSPSLSVLFPEIPKGHKSFGSITLNVAANLIGLGNAATPFGLKAMEQLEEINPNKGTASNSEIMFLVINTSGVTLLPLSVIAVRSSMNVPNPTEVFLPILLATTVATIFGILITAGIQKINLFKREFAKLALVLIGIISVVILGYSYLSKAAFAVVGNLTTNTIMLGIVLFILVFGVVRKTEVFNNFIEGAKESLDLAKRILPYLVAMLVAIGVFKASGALGYFVTGLAQILPVNEFGEALAHALPVALMRPISGGGAEAIMITNIENFVNNKDAISSLVINISSTFQGTTETTFYVIALYFGSVGIKKIRYAAWAGLAADACGIIAAIFLSYIFYT